ncbi:MAG: L-lactate permease [Bacteroidota bacterium]
MGNTIFSFFPILLLIWLMAKKNGMPSNKALPLSALVLYFIALIVFQYDPTLIHANVLAGLLVAWTPILIIAGAIFLFKTMEATGSIAMVKQWLNSVTENKIAQLMIVGWAFPFLIEGASGFGTPAAIAAPVLVGLGYKPVKVAILALIMNTVPVSFGAVGTPTWFGFSAIDLNEMEVLTIAFKSATIHSIVAVFIVTLALLQLVGFKSILKNSGYIILSVASTVIPYLIVSGYNYEFPSLIGGATGLIASVILAQKNIGLTSGDAAIKVDLKHQKAVTGQQLLKATFPLWGTILVLVLTRIPQLGIKQLITAGSPALEIPLGMLGDLSISAALVIGLENIFRTPQEWYHMLLYVPSLIPFGLVSLITFWVFGTPKRDIKAVFGTTVQQMIKPTYALLGALVFVNLMMMGGESSAVNTIGQVLASATGEYWKFFASYLGALGSFFSGSATISNLTFAGIQNSIALETNLDRTTILALQSVGGSFGNMVCINNIVAVTSVLALIGKEGFILKRTALPMIIYGLLTGVIAVMLY